MKKTLLIALIAVAAVPLLYCDGERTAAAVVPVVPGDGLYERLKPELPVKRKSNTVAEASFTASPQEPPLVIEARRPPVARSQKVFRAARFVCPLPVAQPETYTVVLNAPDEADAVIRRIKHEGCDEIIVRSHHEGKLYDAVVRTARQHEVRVNA